MAKPQRLNHLVIHELDQELLLYDPNLDRSHRLNPSASFIWQQCDGQHTVEQIAQLLTDHFEVELADAVKDTQSALQRLRAEQLITDG
ncbi:MAG: Coenzyme PQQ synthesis protein D [Phycisphaerae bacterium]|nr:Coenzyme PQQ synthesis protein D [Phycisphaerae bacterium]